MEGSMILWKQYLNVRTKLWWQFKYMWPFPSHFQFLWRHLEKNPINNYILFSSLGVNFINVKTRAFFVRKLRFGSFSSYISALVPKFRTKNARVNVDEIDTRSHDQLDVGFARKRSDISPALKPRGSIFQVSISSFYEQLLCQLITRFTLILLGTV
jgi:hypothetical protein